MTGSRFPRPIRNNNPFNIKYSEYNWFNKIPLIDNTDKGHVFEQFKTIEYGVRAGLKLLSNYVFHYKLYTPWAIINRFAPNTENHTQAYCDFICSCTPISLDIKEDTVLDTKEKFLYVCSRIIKFETGLNDIALSNLHLDILGLRITYDKFFPKQYYNLKSK